MNAPLNGRRRPGSPTGALVYLRHFWSLAVEDQFYLAWPLVVLSVSPRRLRWICVAALVGGLLVRAGLPFTNFGNHRAILSLTVTRADAMVIGALLALMSRGVPVVSDNAVRWLGFSAALALAVLMLAQGHGAAASPLMRTLGISVLAVASGALVHVAATSPPRWLTTPRLTGLGRISYGVYLYHHPLAIWLQRHEYPAAVRTTVLILVSLPLAWASWRWFEAPILRRKRLWPMPNVRFRP